MCPLAASHLSEEEPCESYVVRQKYDRYEEGFKGSNYDFVALVFETSGAVNMDGLNVLKQIFRCASKRSCTGHSSFCARAWARIASCIQISAAQMILNRDCDDSVEQSVVSIEQSVCNGIVK